ncbi:hypothetical protein ACFL2Q_02375 [Thermodesulfobacteriota bacterium]
MEDRGVSSFEFVDKTEHPDGGQFISDDSQTRHRSLDKRGGMMTVVSDCDGNSIDDLFTGLSELTQRELQGLLRQGIPVNCSDRQWDTMLPQCVHNDTRRTVSDARRRTGGGREMTENASDLGCV